MKVGDIVYVLGKYYPDATLPILLLEVQISHIKRRQFVAYRTDGEVGVWLFSNKDLGKRVFRTKKEAENALAELKKKYTEEKT